MKVAYLVSKYPSVSHTFVLREVAAMRELGIDIETFTVRRAPPGELLDEAARVEAGSTRALLPPPPLGLLAGMLEALRTDPTLLLSCLIAILKPAGLGRGARLKWLAYLAEGILLARWLRRSGCEHLHCHFGNNGASTGMLAARLAGVPFSFTVHGSELRDPERHRLLQKVQAAAFVVCISAFGKAQLMLCTPHTHWARLHVVHCGVPLLDSPAPRSAGQGPLRILCVARLSPEKGHHVLLTVLAQLTERGIPVRCTIVGGGPLRAELSGRIGELGLETCITLAGAQPYPAVQRAYATHDVVVLASLSEGIPVVLMEAMAAGIPVVATWVGGVPELVENGVCGLLVPPGDTTSLVDALERLAKEPGLRQSLGAAGAQRVRAQFDLAENALCLVALFRHVGQAGAADKALGTRVATGSRRRLAAEHC